MLQGGVLLSSAYHPKGTILTDSSVVNMMMYVCLVLRIHISIVKSSVLSNIIALVFVDFWDESTRYRDKL